MGLGAGAAVAQVLQSALKPGDGAAAQPAVAAGATKFCIECGQSIPQNAKFCPMCGKPQ
jgi:membrane protease subunit (stomatin/prohibitin family)